MQETKSLNKRLTHKYVGTYKHLDAHEEIAQYVVMNQTNMLDDDEDDPDPCDHRLTFLYLKITDIKEGLGEDSIADAIYDEFSAGGCSCEHDCCGCRSYTVVQAEKCKQFNYGYRDADCQVWMVLVASSRNY